MEDRGKEATATREIFPIMKKTVTQTMINRWAEVSGDFNPLHIDPEFGKKTFFGSNIAHGPMVLSFVIEMLARFLGKPWIVGGRLENIRMISPVLPNTNLAVGGKVTKTLKEEGHMVIECDVFVKQEEGKILVSGKAACRL
jgi:3-hydroxybutyryl-CoA dehydratase